jgi:hypothetical protein
MRSVACSGIRSDAWSTWLPALRLAEEGRPVRRADRVALDADPLEANCG